MFKLQNLHDDQFNALLNFLRGQDVFVNKPTGSGKSIIYQIAPFAEMALAHRLGENTVWRSKAILVIICTLTFLMKDRVNCLQKLNIIATYVASDQPKSILSSVEQGNYNLVSYHLNLHSIMNAGDQCLPIQYIPVVSWVLQLTKYTVLLNGICLITTATGQPLENSTVV